MLSFFAVLCIVTLVLIGLFLLVLAAPAQRKHACNQILFVLLLINALLILAGVSAHTGGFSIFAYPVPFFISRAVFFLIPPLLYLYVATFTDATRRFRVRHMAPALGVFCVLWVRFAFDTTGAWLPTAAAMAYFGSLFLSFICYYVAAWQLLQLARTQQTAGNAPSRQQWMYATLIVFGIHWGFSTASGLLGFTALNTLVPYTEILSIFSLLVFCCIATYLGARHVPAFAHPHPNRYAGSGLDNATVSNLATTLVQFIEKEKPYLDMDLSAEKLARQAGLTPRQLSQVLNDGLGKPFFDLINTYRVEEAKRLLTDPSHAQSTVLEILHQAGFNSKSAFHRVFSAATGTTPTRYRKRYSEQETA